MIVHVFSFFISVLYKVMKFPTTGLTRTPKNVLPLTSAGKAYPLMECSDPNWSWRP